MGTHEVYPRYDRELSEENRFVPKLYLDKRGSVLESKMTQAKAMDQFLLPKDGEIFSAMPECGLHQTLRSYLLRGVLVEQELFGHFEHIRKIYFKLWEKLKAEKAAREIADLKLVAKEGELAAWRRGEGKWLEMRDDMIKGLKGSNNKKSAQISKLQEDLSHLEHKLHERDEKIKHLTEEVEVVRRESSNAFERARLAHQNAKGLQDRLKEEEAAHEKLRQEATRAALESGQYRESSLAKIQALHDCLTHLESEAYRSKIIENYHNDTLGKVEVALACKVGFDYLEMQLPTKLKTTLEQFHYPPRVANCLSALQEIESKGGGLVLDIESGDEDDEESAQGTGGDSAHDSWVSRPEEEGDGEARSEPQSSPPLTSNAATALKSAPTPSSAPAPGSAS